MDLALQIQNPIDFGWIWILQNKPSNPWILWILWISWILHGFDFDIRIPYGFGLDLYSCSCGRWIMDWIVIVIRIHPATLPIYMQTNYVI